MRRVSLRWKILLYTSLLAVALVAAMVVLVNFQAESFVNDAIAADFEQGRRSALSHDSERLAYMRVTAQHLASFSNLKALLETNDPLTVRDFLLDYQKQNRRAELLIAMDPTGRVMARTDALDAAPIPDVEARWVRPALESLSATGILATEKFVYHVAVVPAAAGGQVFGFVLAGASIDSDYAAELADVTRDEVVIVADRVLASTCGTARLPWKTHAEWQHNAGGSSGPGAVVIDGESFAALPVALSGGQEPRVLAVLLRSRDKALEPYRRIQWSLLVLGLLVAAAGILASAFVAGRLTASIGQLVEGTNRVAAGDFETPLSIESRDEIGDLAQSFNQMIKGLRERADLQKFVSESTVEMIQGNQRRAFPSERRRLTIFFSDVRGFTTMAQDKRPEEVVRMLNACLSLQADCVKKFDGDVDKFVGDSVVALFSGHDSAYHAIRCSVEIIKALDTYNLQNAQEAPIQVGIGVVTGDVILGSIGSEDRQDYTAIGSTVNLCARLCSLAQAREVLMAESSYKLVQDLVAAEKLEPQQVKGFTDPVPVYRIAVH